MAKNVEPDGGIVGLNKGWWSTHTLEKRSVEKNMERFVGFEEIMKLIMRISGVTADKYRALFATMFATGGRINEVLALTKENFSLQGDYIVVTGMPLEKRYLKRGEYLEKWVGDGDPPPTRRGLLYKWDDMRKGWYRRRYKTTKLTDAVRKPFAIPMAEPTSKIMWKYIEEHTGGKLFDLNRVTVYEKFKPLGIWLHWVRGQRASCLRTFYHFEPEDVMNWFSWSSINTALRYAKAGIEDQKVGFSKKEYPKQAEDIAENIVRGRF